MGGRGTGLATKETYGFLLLRIAKDVSELGCTHDTEAHFGLVIRDNIVHKLTTKAESENKNVSQPYDIRCKKYPTASVQARVSRSQLLADLD